MLPQAEDGMVVNFIIKWSICHMGVYHGLTDIVSLIDYNPITYCPLEAIQGQPYQNHNHHQVV